MPSPQHKPAAPRPDFYTRTADFQADYTPAHKTAMDFSNAENPLGASPLARAAIIDALDHIPAYPSADARELRAAITAAHGLNRKNRDVIATAGAGAGILLCVQALMNPGAHIVMPEATFPAALFGATVGHGMGRMARMGADLSIDLNALHVATDRGTSLIFLCNPNNPTGRVLPPQTVIDFAAAQRCPVVVSEANADYTGQSCLDDGYTLPDNLIIVRSFSKIHGLAGLRIGYVAAHPSLMKKLHAAHCPFTVSIPAERAAIAALGDHSHIARSRTGMDTQRAVLQDRLRAIGMDSLPSDANTMMVGIPARFKGSAEFTNHLAERGISVVSGVSFCQSAARYVRISPRTPDMNAGLIRILAEVCR